RSARLLSRTPLSSAELPARASRTGPPPRGSEPQTRAPRRREPSWLRATNSRAAPTRTLVAQSHKVRAARRIVELRLRRRLLTRACNNPAARAVDPSRGSEPRTPRRRATRPSWLRATRRSAVADRSRRRLGVELVRVVEHGGLRRAGGSPVVVRRDRVQELRADAALEPARPRLDLAQAEVD